MIAKLLNRLFPARSRAQRIADAAVTWNAARAAYADAKTRRDTRAQNQAARDVRAAAQGALRAELGR